MLNSRELVSSCKPGQLLSVGKRYLKLDVIFRTMIDDFFVHFSAKRKVDYINKVGIHLASRIHNRFIIELYQLYDSYVEVWYNPVSCSIYKVKTHKSDQCFEPYLENISLDL